jgi:cell division initiation protein
MKITPLEIRQKQFEKEFRGYDREEVAAFLLSMSNEWERILDEQKDLKYKLEQSEKEVQKLREVESSLYKTLKTAEDTGANMIDQATKAAQLHMKETQINAESMLSEAKSRARAIIEKAEAQSRNIIEEMQDATKDIERNYRAIENYQDDLINQLNTLSSDISGKVSKMKIEGKKFSLEDHMNKVRKVVRDSQAMIENEPMSIKTVEAPKMPAFKPMVKNEEKPEAAKKNVFTATNEEIKKKQAAAKQKAEEPKPKKSESEVSFFDQIDD